MYDPVVDSDMKMMLSISLLPTHFPLDILSSFAPVVTYHCPLTAHVSLNAPVTGLIVQTVFC
jgi:hypothetical protein